MTGKVREGTATSPSHWKLAMMVDAWRKCRGGEGLLVVHGISAQGDGRGVAVERDGGGVLGSLSRECQLRAERGCGGASRWALCVDNTV